MPSIGPSRVWGCLTRPFDGHSAGAELAGLVRESFLERARLTQSSTQLLISAAKTPLADAHVADWDWCVGK
jgi:hypothetical protein